jgi:hypothetical protein
MLEWAALWKPLPKVVFSTTLPAVPGHARLACGGVAEEMERLRAEPEQGWRGRRTRSGGHLRGVPPAVGLRFDPRQKLWVFPWPVLRGG